MAKETRTYEMRRHYLSKMTNVRRMRLKQKMIELKGGHCQICGYRKYYGALDFHHISRKTKQYSLSMDKLYISWEKIQLELEKCMLVCANCHREIHAGVIDLQKLGLMI